jgi:hypothetical protein
MTRPTTEGLKSDALRAALQGALQGDTARLEALLARHGGMPGPKPNLKLAAAFGIELGALPGSLAPLLSKFGDDDAAPDDPRVFLPIAAAHGWAQRLRAEREVEPAWRALEQLAADERGPVRVGTLDALLAFTLRDGGSDQLVARAIGWLDSNDRELMFGAAALVIEALADPRVVAGIREHEQLLDYLARAIDKVARAARSAERSEGRRRVLTSLPGALALVIALVRSGERGLRWFEEQCGRASHPDVRLAFSQALIRLHKIPQAPAGTIVEGLRQALTVSAKPLRDPTLVRPGTGRGRRSRNTR